MATDDHMKVTGVGPPSGGVGATCGRYELENGQHSEDVVLGYSTDGTLNEVCLPIDDAFSPPGNARFVTRDFPSRSTSHPRAAPRSPSPSKRADPPRLRDDRRLATTP